MLFRSQKQKVLNRRNKHRFNKKEKLKNSVGGKCQICGYDKCQRALHFHHIDPTTKSFEIAPRLDGNINTIMKEVQKCIMICSNCHRIRHYKENRIKTI